MRRHLIQIELNLRFEPSLTRMPKDEERKILLASVERLKREFAADLTAAEKYLAVGETKRNSNLDLVEEAAYAAFSLGLLNMDETVTKNNDGPIARTSAVADATPVFWTDRHRHRRRGAGIVIESRWFHTKCCAALRAEGEARDLPVHGRRAHACRFVRLQTEIAGAAWDADSR